MSPGPRAIQRRGPKRIRRLQSSDPHGADSLASRRGPLLDRKARQGRNHAKGETIQMAEITAIKDRPAKILNYAVSPSKQSAPPSRLRWQCLNVREASPTAPNPRAGRDVGNVTGGSRARFSELDVRLTLSSLLTQSEVVLASGG